MTKEHYFEFDPEKNSRLQQERGISFEQIIALMEAGHILDVRTHHNPQKYPNQHVIEVGAAETVYLVPCVITQEKIFLKTVYPSRKALKRQKRGKIDA